jgi:hypothetical protein
MDFIDSELVILEVQKHSCIYDTKSEHYKDRQMRIDAWITISKSLGEEWEAPSTTTTRSKHNADTACLFNSLRFVILVKYSRSLLVVLPAFG